MVDSPVEESLGANPAEAALNPADPVAMGVAADRAPGFLASSRGRAFRALAHDSFRLLFAAFLINQTGFWISHISIQALMVELTDNDPFHLGLLFAAIFKLLPDVQIQWRDVWIGAVGTALLFTIGKYAISLYLGYAAPGSSYGAVGSLIVVQLWTYYSAQILFLGAEFTQAYARMYGSRIVPDPHARFVTSEQRIEQGLSA